MKKQESAVVIGYSGHSYVILKELTLQNISVKGYFDLEEKKTNPYNLKYLGVESSDQIKNHSDCSFYICIGENSIRKKIFQILGGKDTPNLISKNSACFLKSIGIANFIGTQTIINPEVEIGNNNIINTGAIIEHECRIGNHNHIGPGAILCGNVSVGDNVYIGAGAIIKQGVKIATNTIIGMGAVVLNDADGNIVIAGNPAKEMRKL